MVSGKRIRPKGWCLASASDIRIGVWQALRCATQQHCSKKRREGFPVACKYTAHRNAKVERKPELRKATIKSAMRRRITYQQRHCTSTTTVKMASTKVQQMAGTIIGTFAALPLAPKRRDALRDAERMTGNGRGRVPDSSHTMEFEETDESRTRPGRVPDASSAVLPSKLRHSAVGDVGGWGACGRMPSGDSARRAGAYLRARADFALLGVYM
eukprot:gene23402-biopygen23829